MGDLDFSPDALTAFLAEALGPSADGVRVERISGGQSNPTYFVGWGGEELVLRKQPLGPILRGAHAVDREFRVLEALYPTKVPVPRPIVFEADAAVLGTPFYLMARVPGRVYAHYALADVPKAERTPMLFAKAEAMATLHAIDPAAVGLGDFGRPGNYFERQLARWTKQWRGSDFGPIPALDALIAWLEDALPADDGRVAIAHGDLRLGNVLFEPAAPRIAAILDWELATLGHPLADLGFAVMAWHVGPDEYGGLLGVDVGEQGLPRLDEFVAHYMAHAAPTAPLRPFHVAFAMFRFAVIFVGIADRAKAGSASGHNAAALAPLAHRFAARGLEVATEATW